jgi:hypothetical protein
MRLLGTCLALASAAAFGGTGLTTDTTLEAVTVTASASKDLPQQLAAYGTRGDTISAGRSRTALSSMG